MPYDPGYDRKLPKGDIHNARDGATCYWRRLRVNQLTRAGYSAREIAVMLAISPKTVHRYRNQPIQKRVMAYLRERD